MRNVWVKQSEKALCDPWQIEPDAAGHTIVELKDIIPVTRS